ARLQTCHWRSSFRSRLEVLRGEVFPEASVGRPKGTRRTWRRRRERKHSYVLRHLRGVPGQRGKLLRSCGQPGLRGHANGVTVGRHQVSDRSDYRQRESESLSPKKSWRRRVREPWLRETASQGFQRQCPV